MIDFKGSWRQVNRIINLATDIYLVIAVSKYIGELHPPNIIFFIQSDDFTRYTKKGKQRNIWYKQYDITTLAAHNNAVRLTILTIATI